MVRKALVLADAEGMDAVTVRRLAGELGVSPMALYWHFRSKDDLLDGMAAGFFDELTLPPTDSAAAWDQQLRSILRSMVDTLRVHPSVAGLLTTRTVSTQRSLRVTESMLELLRRGGFPPHEATQVARHALHAVAGLVDPRSGLDARPEPEDRTDARRHARLFLESLPPDEYPRLVEAAVPLSEGVRPDDHYAFGLDLLLAGITAMATRHR